MKLRVLARGTAMVCPPEAVASTPKRFIGRKWDPSFGDGKKIAGAWVPIAEPVEVPLYQEGHAHFEEAKGEYIKCVQEGDLWAADAETAATCGVPFDPTFGGAEVYRGLVVKDANSTGKPSASKASATTS